MNEMNEWMNEWMNPPTALAVSSNTMDSGFTMYFLLFIV
jgi:hypothetical protein